MSNLSSQTTVLVGARAVGSKDQQGLRHGGIYYPAHTKNGKVVSARWEGQFAMNSRDYRDAQGNKQDGRVTYIRLVVWNGKNAAAGKGLADVFAKCVSPGKELSCNVDIESFEKRLFIGGQPMLDAQNNQITIPAINFRVTDNIVFGNDSAAILASEINAFNPAAPALFGARPQDWNLYQSPANNVWKQIVASRMSHVWDGQSPSYGYARIIVPEGAQLTAPGMAAPVVGAAPTVAAGVVAHAPAPGGNTPFAM